MTSGDTVRNETLAPPPLRRSARIKSKGPATKSVPPNRSNGLNDSAPVSSAPKRGRGRHHKDLSATATTNASVPNRSEVSNDSAPAASAPKRPGRPPKRKAESGTAAAPSAPPPAKKARSDAQEPTRSNNLNDSDPAPSRPKRVRKPSAKAREALENATAAAPVDPNRSNKLNDSDGVSAAPDERIHSREFWQAKADKEAKAEARKLGLKWVKEKGEEFELGISKETKVVIPEEVWVREFAAVLPEPNQSHQIGGRGGEEED